MKNQSSGLKIGGDRDKFQREGFSLDILLEKKEGYV